MVYDLIWGESQRKKRKPVRQSKRTDALIRSKGKCEKCGTSLRGIKPHIHHKNGNPSDNRSSNLIVLCPNCHSGMHQWKTVTERDMLGFETKRRKLVTKRVRKKSTKKRKKKRKKKEDDYWGRSVFDW